MFYQKGLQLGAQHGENDAIHRRRYRPRPQLILSLISTAYQKSYSEGYRRAYYMVQQTRLREDLRKKYKWRGARNTAPKHKKVERDRRANLLQAKPSANHPEKTQHR